MFAIKRKIGDGTWRELTRCREKRKAALVFFAHHSFCNVDLNDENQVKDWSALLEKKKELTRDWFEVNSRAVTPKDPYQSIEALQTTVTAEIKWTLSRDIFGKLRTFETAESELPQPVKWEHQINATHVRDFRSRLRIQEGRATERMSNQEFLIGRGFIERGALNMAGQLLFTDVPHEHYKGAWLKCFRVFDRASGGDYTRLDLYGPLHIQLDQALEFIKNNVDEVNLFNRASLSSERALRFPARAIRELLANALVHRNYEDNNRIVSLTIYSERIVIQSPGEWSTKIDASNDKMEVSELVSESI